MFFANDHNNNRVYIDDAHSNEEYYCPYCGAPLITREYEDRKNHFAHKQNHLCSDSWGRDNSYDVSSWHKEWQSLFPKENQEIKLSLGDIHHRADVLVGRTVIEFQHSIMPVKSFDDRNNFYFNLGYKVVWLFDLAELVQNNQLTYSKDDDGLVFNWSNPKRAFNNYDIKSGCIDLFFQLNDEKDCIVRVTDVSRSGFERFYTTNLMSKSEFLAYVGVKNGTCLPPCRDDIEHDEQYQAFKEKYHIDLNRQQERALQAVEGSNLLLAVPGSGKTTVLVARLGHMIINKGIKPENILAVTYNKVAANELKEKFSSKFGKDAGNRIKFQTLNALALEIYKDYCRKNNRPTQTLIDDKEKRDVLRKIYKKFTGNYAAENNILELSAATSYIKNMALSDDVIRKIKAPYPHFYEMYKEYQDTLKKKRKMDFDDQLVFAHWILRNDTDTTNALRNRYKYLCIDEAQDTSKIQHLIIKILAQGNNIFMVGDEDQSIYGFRAAYPEALLNFRYDYPNPYILRMERNYRSTIQIVEKAREFISKNKGRYEKSMVANCGDGEQVHLEKVNSREEQYIRLLEIAKNAKTETAFLYRDNESAVVLVDMFLRNNIEFKLRKPEMNFFGIHIVKDIVAYLSLAINEKDTVSFEQICNKGILCLNKQQKEYAIKNCKDKQISIYCAVEEQMKYVKQAYKHRASIFRNVMAKVASSTSSDAITILLDKGYSKYIKDNHLDNGKIEILMMLAKQEPEIKKFLFRLQELEKKMSQEFSSNTENHIILSTIHSSKGLEYDCVYMVDVYDGRFPSSKQHIFCRSKDSANAEQEERRLFYVGITRAKNKLQLFSIANKPSAFIDDIFSEPKAISIKVENKIPKNLFWNIGLAEYLKDKKASDDKYSGTDYMSRYKEVEDKFVQQDTQIIDSTGTRWIKCEICDEIKEDREFVTYGGANKINLGICSKCDRQKNPR